MDKWELHEIRRGRTPQPPNSVEYGAVCGTGPSVYRISFGSEDKAMAEQHVAKLNEGLEPMVPGTVTISEGQHTRLLKLAHLAQTYFDMTQDSRTWGDWAHRARTVWIKNFKAVGMHVQEHKVYSAEIQTWCPL